MRSITLTWPVVAVLLAVEALSFIGIAGLALAVWHFHAPAENVSDARPAGRQIKAILEAQAAAWNRGDLEGFMDVYWNDEKLRFHSGNDITLGWQATLDRYREKYQRGGKVMGTLTFSELHADGWSENLGVAWGRWKVNFPDGKSSEGLFTLHLRRIDGWWKIVYDHTSAKQQ